jgi:hypothetical protein
VFDFFFFLSLKNIFYVHYIISSILSTLGYYTLIKRELLGFV